LAIAGLKGAVKLSGGPVDAGISELLIEVSESGVWSLLSSKAFSSFSEEASFLVLSGFNDFSYNLLHFMSIANYPRSCTTTSPPTTRDNDASGYSMVAS
jgi:hypothetical protein